MGAKALRRQDERDIEMGMRPPASRSASISKCQNWRYGSNSIVDPHDLINEVTIHTLQNLLGWFPCVQVTSHLKRMRLFCSAFKSPLT